MPRKQRMNETMSNDQRKRFLSDPNPLSSASDTMEFGSDFCRSATCPEGATKPETSDANTVDRGNRSEANENVASPPCEKPSKKEVHQDHHKCDQVDAKSKASVCGSCGTVKRVSYCGECQKYDCSRCRRRHSKDISTSRGALKTSSDVSKCKLLNTNTLKQPCSIKCTVHSEFVILFYCTDHNVFCCKDCITIDHRTCKRVSVEDAASAVDIRKLSRQTLSDAGEQTNGLAALVTHMHNYRNILKKDRKETSRVVKETTRLWVSRLIELESNTLDKVGEFYDKQLEELNADHRTCKTMIGTLNEEGKRLDLHLDETSLDAFVTVKRVHRLTRKFDKVLRNIRENIKIAKLTFLPNPELQKIDSESMVGEVRIECDYPYKPKSTNTVCARAAGEVSSWAVNDKTDETCITGLEELPDGRMIIVDSGNKRVKLFDDNGTLASCLDIQDMPWDIAVVNSSRALVTIPNLQAVQIINVTNEEIINGDFICVDTECLGITTSGEEEIIVSFYDGKSSAGIMKVNYNGDVIRRLDNSGSGADTFSRPNYLCQSTTNDLLYVSDCDKGVLSVKLSDFTIISRYTNSELLKCPLGLTVLSNGCIYVCGSQSNNIVQLSSDGTNGTEVLSAKDGLSLSQNVCCVKGEAAMIVSLDKQYKLLQFHFKAASAGHN